MSIVISTVSGLADSRSNSAGGPELLFIGITVGIVAVLMILAAVRFFRGDQRSLKKVLDLSSKDPTVRQAGAQSAYAHGDYKRVCKILTNSNGARLSDASLAECLLLSAACNQLGGFARAAEEFGGALAQLGTNPREQNTAIENLPSWERRIILELKEQMPVLASDVIVKIEPVTGSSSQMWSLATLRTRVVGEKSQAKRTASGWQRWNVGLGAASAGLAAIAGGVSSVVKVQHGPNWIPLILGLVSAAISTVLITLKPAEVAEKAEKTANALDDLEADIDLFETDDRPYDAQDIRSARIEVQNRLRAAKNRPLPNPLVARRNPDQENPGPKPTTHEQEQPEPEPDIRLSRRKPTFKLEE